MGYSSSPIVASDSVAYIEGAKEFPNLLNKRVPYTGLILYLKALLYFESNGWIVLLFNSLIVLVAAEALWQVTKNSSDYIASWIAVCIWLLNPLTSQWTRFLMGEPLFFSAVIGWIWFAIYKPTWLFLFLSSLVSSLRPNAFTLLGSALTWWIPSKINSIRTSFILIISSWATVFIIFWAFILRSSPDAESLLDVAKNGLIMPSNGEFKVSIEMSDSIFSYLKLFLTRIGWELVQLRPWYSAKLNSFIAIFMTFFYIFALRGAWIVRFSKLFWAVIVVSIPSIVLIGCTWAIYEARFGWWFLVAWIPFVAIGSRHLLPYPMRYLQNQIDRLMTY